MRKSEELNRGKTNIQETGERKLSQETRVRKSNRGKKNGGRREQF